jgi:iron complex outermembrane receptor protein
VELLGYGLRHDMGNLYQGYYSADSTGLYSGALDEIYNNTGGVSLTYKFKGDLLARPANLTMGMEYRYETEGRKNWSAYKNNGDKKGPQTADWDFTFNAMSFFGQMDYQILRPLRLVAGLRWDTFDGEADISQYDSEPSYVGKHSTSDDLSKWSPKVGLVFEPFEHWELFANYSEGFSLPTGISLFTQDDVKPAVRHQLEGGFRGRPVQWLDFAVTGFIMETTDDLEDIAESGMPANYVNAGETRRIGFEAEANIYPAEDWRLYLNYSYIDARYIETDVEEDKQYMDNSMRQIPNHVANLELRYAPPLGLGGRAWLRYVGESPANMENDHTIDDYAVVDLQLNYRFNDQYMLALDVVNLFDIEYESSASWGGSYWNYVPGAPLGFYLTLTVDW